MGYKIVLYVALGSAFTGCLLAVAGYFAAITSAESAPLGSESDWWFLVVGIDLIAGLIIGGISAMVIVGFNMSYVKAVIFGGTINLLIVLGFYIFTNGQMSQGIRYSLYSLVPIGLINGAIVSWFSSTSQALK